MVSFSPQDLIDHILRSSPTDQEVDLHLQPQFSMCPFCAVNFTVYSRVEQLAEDEEYVFRRSKIPEKKIKNLFRVDKRRNLVSERDLLFWRNVSKTDVQDLYEWYLDDFLAFGYTVSEYFKQIGLDYLPD